MEENLKVGEYLYCTKGVKKDIRSGDGIVGTFEVNQGEMYQIIEINEVMNQLCINYKGHSLWFSIDAEFDYFTEWYKLYFNDIKVMRKEKLKKIF